MGTVGTGTGQGFRTPWLVLPLETTRFGVTARRGGAEQRPVCIGAQLRPTLDLLMVSSELNMLTRTQTTGTDCHGYGYGLTILYPGYTREVP